MTKALKTSLGMLLLLIALGCILLAPESTTPPTEEVPVTTGELTSTFTVTPKPSTSEALERPTTTPEPCSRDAAFVEDVTIPDDTRIESGAGFRKTWRLRNTGTCAWEPGTALVFVGGDALNGPDSVAVPAAAAGTTVDISVELTAPAAPGTYRSEWRLQAPDGTRFGPTIYAQIIVPETPTMTPTATPTLPPTETSTVEPTLPTPTPTISPTVDGSGCTTPYDPAFAATMDYADNLNFDVGCAQGPAYEVTGAVQIFWANVDNPNPHLHYRTLMIWNRPYKQGEIYYVTVSETSPVQPISVAYDTWDESEPEVPSDCAEMTVPEGYLMPVRGFGKLWCERELWTTIGWPSEPEMSITFLVQRTEHGRLMRLGDPLINTYVVAWHHDRGEALVHMNPIGP